MTTDTPFTLRPKLRTLTDGARAIGFFESRSEQAWAIVNPEFADDANYWGVLAECLKFHAHTLKMQPDNADLARELQEYYGREKDRKIRAGRPTESNIPR